MEFHVTGSGGGSRKRTARHLAEALPQPTRPARRQGRSRPAMSARAAAAARTPRRATARATPTRTARPVIPARSSGAGRASGCSTRCTPGARFTDSCRRPTTGRARTRDAAAARCSSAWPMTIGRRRAWSPPSSEPGWPRAPPCPLKRSAARDVGRHNYSGRDLTSPPKGEGGASRTQKPGNTRGTQALRTPAIWGYLRQEPST